ncbi:Glutamate receptor ionotropic, kainate [Dirofilaria immitis]
MKNSKQDFTNVTSQVDTHDDIFHQFCKLYKKIHPLVKIRKYIRSTDMGEDNQPVKHLTNYKLPNSYTFFGTIHIKTSATMLTLFYMLLLAVSDLVADTTLIDSSLFTYVSTVNIIIMLAILLALYGIWKELSLCLLPLIVIQVLLGAMMILILTFSSIIELHCFLIEACSGGRFLMIAMGSVMFCVLYCYCVIIIWLCWKYFRYLERKAELERSWRAETIDDELDENILIHNLPSNIHNNH